MNQKMIRGGIMVDEPGMLYEDSYGMSDMSEETGAAQQMGQLLSSRVFVGSVSAGVFLLSIAIGVLLAKLRMKKGFDIYED